MIAAYPKGGPRVALKEQHQIVRKLGGGLNIPDTDLSGQSQK